MKLKKIMAAAAIGAATLSGGSAFAQSMTPVEPRLTAEELAAVRTIREVLACDDEKRAANERQIALHEEAVAEIRARIDAQAQAMADRQWPAMEKALLDAATAEGVSPKVAQMMADSVRRHTVSEMVAALRTAAQYPDRPRIETNTRAACFNELNLSEDVLAQQEDQMVRKYGANRYLQILHGPAR